MFNKCRCFMLCCITVTPPEPIIDQTFVFVLLILEETI